MQQQALHNHFEASETVESARSRTMTSLVMPCASGEVEMGASWKEARPAFISSRSDPHAPLPLPRRLILSGEEAR